MQADKKKVGHAAENQARGQIDGILNMIEEDRYCIDISHQLMATMAILNKANKEVLSAHLKTCVRNAETAAERDEKIDELIEIMGKDNQIRIFYIQKKKEDAPFETKI